MSVLAHIYVATDASASEYDSNPLAFQGESATWQRITPMELSTLWALIKAVEWKDEILDPFFPEVWVSEDGQRAISQLPKEFLADLQAVDDAKLPSMIDEWAATDELKCPPQQLRPFLDDLRRLSRIALQSGRNVYIWNHSEDADEKAADREFLVTRDTPVLRLVVGGMLAGFTWVIYLIRIVFGTGPMHDYQGREAPPVHYLIGAVIITGAVAFWIGGQAIAEERRRHKR